MPNRDDPYHRLWLAFPAQSSDPDRWARWFLRKVVTERDPAQRATCRSDSHAHRLILATLWSELSDPRHRVAVLRAAGRGARMAERVIQEHRYPQKRRTDAVA